MKNKLIVLFVMCTCLLSAQETPGQKELLGKLSDETCAELQNLDVEKEPNQESLTLKLGLAIQPAYNKHKKEIEKLFHLDMDKVDDQKELGQKLGVVLVANCSKMRDVSRRLADLWQQQRSANRSGADNTMLEVSGKIKKTEQSDFFYVYVETSDGEMLKLAVLFPINNETELLDVLRGRSDAKVKIGYSIRQVFSVTDSEFKSLKIIASVKEL